jgi:glycosyltransferase involved in cell wall biosynthesis
LESRPFFSIITACLNRAEFIETAIQSVMAHNYSDLEHIIIDGGSTDGTLDILKKYPHLRVFSGPDRGVYDAFNKGIDSARGEVLTFLNDDDRWAFGFLPAVAAEFNRDANLEVITTNAAVYERGKNNEWEFIKRLPAISSGENFFNELHRRGPAINAWFIRRCLFDRIGSFNSAFHYGADQDFCIRAAIHDVNLRSINLDAYQYLVHTGSLTFHRDPEKRIPSIRESFLIIEGFFQKEKLLPFQVKFLRNWYRSLALREIKRGLRLVKPTRIFESLGQYLKSYWL